MRTMTSLAAVFALALLAQPALADETPTTATLQASGQGTANVVPDIAIVSLGVSSSGRSASDALTANSTALTAAIAAVEAAGVAEKDIATTGLNIYPVYATNSDGTQVQPPKVTGYSVSNEVRVTIRDITKAGDLLDKVVAAGANRIDGISFDVSDRKAADDGALTDAIAEAMRKGQLMATAANLKLVRVLSVTTAAAGEPPRAVYALAKAAVASVPVMPGEQETDVTATMVWEVAPLE